MAYYGLYQHEYGTMTTVNGKSADRLHRFETKAMRDQWVHKYSHASAISRREAEKLAHRLHGGKLDDIPEVCADEGLHSDGPHFGELAKGYNT